MENRDKGFSPKTAVFLQQETTVSLSGKTGKKREENKGFSLVIEKAENWEKRIMRSLGGNALSNHSFSLNRRVPCDGDNCLFLRERREKERLQQRRIYLPKSVTCVTSKPAFQILCYKMA